MAAMVFHNPTTMGNICAVSDNKVSISIYAYERLQNGVLILSLEQFRSAVLAANSLKSLRAGLIGEGTKIPGLKGPVPLVYADYTASGRALRQVENFILQDVLPFYANSHTEASFCGAYMTELRNEARETIKHLTNSGSEAEVIFTGAGATAGLNRLVSLLGIQSAERPIVLLGPYEHHSNILPWRETKADVIEIPEAPQGGGPDTSVLRATLDSCSDADLVVASFSAASNVTGALTDVDAVTDILKQGGARVVWDYAGGAPYLPIDMRPPGHAPKDAVVFSPHKFPGGPGASGVLIVRHDAVAAQTPTWPGGGTVSFVSPWAHQYADSLAAREEAGTPNIIGDIRAALACIIKDVIGQKQIAEIEHHYNQLAKDNWSANPQLELLGIDNPNRLPIFSFRITDQHGTPIHHQLFTRMLSDIYGIQARGGCACAGPYAHRLLHIDKAQSIRIHDALREAKEIEKPGWVRLNFSYMMSPETVHYIIDSVNSLTRNLDLYVGKYEADTRTAKFRKHIDADALALQ